MGWLQDGHRSAADAATDGAELLTLEPGEMEMYPHISPDGKYLLVVSGKSRKPVVSRRLTENGDPVNLVSDYDPLLPDSIAWHGDAAVTFLSERADSLGLWVKPVGGGVIRRLFRLEGELRNPIVLNDGSMIAVRLRIVSSHLAATGRKASAAVFNNWHRPGYQSSLVRIDPAGAEQQLSAGDSPALSPDGRRLAFSMQNGRSRHLFIMNVDGSGLIQLTQGAFVDVQPTWSPDSKWVAFTSNRGRFAHDAAAEKLKRAGKTNWDIWRIGADGRGLTRLTRDPARDGAPTIAANGNVYFHSDRRISKHMRALHQVQGRVKGFHIWRIATTPADESIAEGDLAR